MIVLDFLRTLIGYPLILGWMCCCAIAIAILGERPASDAVLRHWLRFALRVAGARVVTAGVENVDPTRSYVLVANHTSHMDAPAIVTTSPVPPRFIAKRELSRIPLFGTAARRMGHVFVNRRDSQGATRAVRRRIQKGLSGVGLFFFAEGTRALTDELLPFKKGAAVAALDTQLDVIPLGIAGAREVLRPKGFALFRPGIIAVVYGPPIPIAGHTYEARDALVAAQRAAVEKAVAQARELRAQAMRGLLVK